MGDQTRRRFDTPAEAIRNLERRLDRLEAAGTPGLPVWAWVYRSSAFTISSASTWTFLTFNAEASDDLGWHDNSTNPERITVDRDGLYYYEMQVQSGSLTGASRFIYRVLRNATAANAGTSLERSRGEISPSTLTAFHERLTGVVTLSAGDHLEIAVWSSATGNLTTNGNGHELYMKVIRLGDVPRFAFY